MFIDRLVRFVLPRQDTFFTMLEEIAAQMKLAADLFEQLASATSLQQLISISARLKLIETEADQICHRLYGQLDRTFVTPIDREDLAHLTKSLDDVIDSMEHVAAFTALFRFETLTEPMRQMIRLTVQAVSQLPLAVSMLRNFSNPDSIRELTVAIHSLENEADAIYRTSIANLFTDSIDARELVRQKDMLWALENGVDTCEDAMDVIRSVVVKKWVAPWFAHSGGRPGPGLRLHQRLPRHGQCRGDGGVHQRAASTNGRPAGRCLQRRWSLQRGRRRQDNRRRHHRARLGDPNGGRSRSPRGHSLEPVDVVLGHSLKLIPCHDWRPRRGGVVPSGV